MAEETLPAPVATEVEKGNLAIKTEMKLKQYGNCSKKTSNEVDFYSFNEKYFLTELGLIS